MSLHLFHVILPSFSRCFAIAYVYCRCFSIAYVCDPTLILNFIVRCDVFSSKLLIFRHLCHAILLSFCRCFAIAYVCCRCFAIAYVCDPTLILNFIVRWMFYHPNCLCFAIFAMLSCYLFTDVLPSHMFVADVSPSHVFVILILFLISLLVVTFYHLNCIVSPSLPCNLAIF